MGKLYLAVYAAWAYTTWAVTLVPAEDPRTRRMRLAVMFVGLFMNAAIPRAFGDAGWVFVATFLLIHIGRTVWLLTVGLDPVNQEHFRRVLVWFVAPAPLWVTGAAADGGARPAWWAAAILVELVGTWAAHPLPGRRLDSREVTFAGGHLLERGRLFVIIAFGETVMTTGTALTTAPYQPMTLLTSSVALTGTVALFWLFFSHSERVVSHYQRTEDPMRAGRSGVISLMASVAGLIAVAVADERVIAHPTEHAGITTNLLLFGGLKPSTSARRPGTGQPCSTTCSGHGCSRCPLWSSAAPSRRRPRRTWRPSSPPRSSSPWPCPKNAVRRVTRVRGRSHQAPRSLARTPDLRRPRRTCPSAVAGRSVRPARLSHSPCSPHSPGGFHGHARQYRHRHRSRPGRSPGAHR
nr:low temperature requirement protein A [Streptomyces sp. S1D4-11]QIZ01368.1 low temperature requirement protein A [Streptomyces sp. S1D4-11]